MHGQPARQNRVRLGGKGQGLRVGQSEGGGRRGCHVIRGYVTSRDTYIFLAGLDSGGDLEFLGKGLVFSCIDLVLFEDGKWLFDVEFLDPDLAGVHR